tara:strand:+ start:72 stop:281 length:210 start_codon:yes stop_codon:yes gene_type:complete
MNLLRDIVWYNFRMYDTSVINCDIEAIIALESVCNYYEIRDNGNTNSIRLRDEIARLHNRVWDGGSDED